jgi:hypothetical protein
VHAGDAEVLPKGNFAFNVDYKHYLPWDKRYDKDGNTQDAASDFNAPLDKNVFPDLAAFEAFGVTNPNLGTTVTSFKYKYERVDTTLAYGITDKLSIGVKVPYIWYKNEVKARLDTTNANVGLNPAFDPTVTNPADPRSLPLIPVSMGGSKLTTEDMQKLLGPGLPGIAGYGFKRFETWEQEGVGDIETGLKYQYYSDDKWKLAALGGVLWPTGEKKDPDSLVSQPLGGGSYALLFRSYNDFTGIKHLTFNGSVFYTLTLPQDSERRIVTDPHKPLSDTKKNVEIDPGDILEFETSVKWQIPWVNGCSVEGLYHFTKTFKDSVSGSITGPQAQALESETDGEDHFYIAKISYSTIPLFLQKKFPLPMDISVAFRDKFAGNNNSFKTQYIQGSLTIYF